MKTWKSKILCILLCLGSCALLAGCHGAKALPEFVVPEELDLTRQYNLTFWAKNDTNRIQTDIYRQAIADFERLYPNISVNLRLYTNYSDIYNDVITNISTSTTPNICISYPDHIATYLNGENVVVPLDALLEDERYGAGGTELLFDGASKEELIQKFLDEGTFQGHVYALPFMRSTEACYVNKTYVEALGYTLPEVLTWDFVWEVSEAAMRKDAQGNYALNGQKVMIPFIYKSTDNYMIQMLRQQSAGYSTDDGEILLFQDTTKELLRTIVPHAKSGAFSTFKISSYPGNFMNAGQCLFAIDSTAGATWIGSHAPLSDISEDKLVEFETEVMMVPQFDPSRPQMISQGPSVCIFNKKDASEVLASFLFAEYLLTNEVQIAYAKTEGYIPVTTKAQEAAEYRDYLSRAGEDNDAFYDVKIKASKLLLSNIENTFVTPVWSGSASLRDAAGALIENTVKSVRRKETIDDRYFTEMFDKVRTLYRLDGSGMLSAQKQETKELPSGAVWFLCVLAAIWLFLAVYCAFEVKKKQKKAKRH